MPTLIRLKSGETVIAEGDVTPEKLKRIGATMVASPQGGTAPQNMPKPKAYDEAEVQRRAAKPNRRDGPLYKIASAISPALGMAAKNSGVGAMIDNFTDQYTFGLDRKFNAATSGITKGVSEAIRQGDVSKGFEAGKREYANTNEAANRQLNRAKAERPIESTAGNIAGLLMNPLGAETGVGKVLTKVAPGAVKTAKALPGAKMVTKAAESTIGRAARAGGNQAAVAAAVNGDSIGDAYGTGAVLGGTVGAALKGGMGIKKALNDRSAGAAERVAARRAGQIIGRARDDAGNVITPKQLEQNIASERAAGSPSVVADVSPESMYTAAALARKPGLESANQLIRFGERRIDDAGTRFNENLNSKLSPDGQQISATQGKAALTAERKLDAKTDYGDDVMKAELQDTPDMLDFIQNAPAITQQALKTAAKNIGRDNQVAKLALEFDDAGQPVFTKIPNMAVLDEVKKAYDSIIGQSLKAGDGAWKAAKTELDILRKIVGEQNPAYLKSLYNQRGYYEKIAALEEGTSFLTRLQREPEKLLMELQASKGPIEGVKYGVADAILALRHTKAEPLKQLRGMMRSKEQRDVMKWLFGDEKKFNDFYKFMRTELRNSGTDNALARGRTSPTDVLGNYGKATDEADALGDLATKATTGGAFGGGLGVASAGLRWHKAVTSSMSRSAQDQLAKILIGDGAGLSKKVLKAKAYERYQTRKTKKQAEMAGKVTGAYVGQQGD